MIRRLINFLKSIRNELEGIRFELSRLNNSKKLNDSEKLNDLVYERDIQRSFDLLISHEKDNPRIIGKNGKKSPRMNINALAIEIAKDCDGLFLEFGVFKGGDINYFAKKIKNKTIYGFDSFEGLPEFWREGFLEGQAFNLDGKMPKVMDNVSLVKGWFEDSLPIFLKNHKEKIAFLHIDCDLYSSTKTVLDLLSEQIVDGTYILFDEYMGYSGWEIHEHKAFMEFVEKNDISYELVGFSLAHQVLVKIKKVLRKR